MAQEKMTLEDWLDDLCVRFIINLPQEDLQDIARICFQIEEAQWFYEDFIRPLDPNLPSMSLKTFSLKMFQHCPLFAAFSQDDHMKAFEQFLQYKTRVPVRGAIMLNAAMDSAVLVRGYKKGSGWSFPRGKIAKDEPDLDCAVREVYEETGFDLSAAGLVDRNAPVQPLEVTMKDQQVRLYVFRHVPEDTIFEPKTRKEIGAIRWYKLSDLPAYRKRKVGAKGQETGSAANDRFYMVAPFMVQLRSWVSKQRKLDPQNAMNRSAYQHPLALDDVVTDDNLWHEPARAVPAPETAHPAYAERGTEELRRLFGVSPSAQHSQAPTTGSSLEAGQQLLTLLQQPRNAPAHPHPQTPADHMMNDAAQPRPPHHQHSAQPAPVSMYDQPPPFPISHDANMHYQQHRHVRPEVQFTTDVQGQSSFQVSPRHYSDNPVQLLHPQPLPPQVQGDRLMRSMLSSSMNQDPTMRSAPAGHTHNPAQGHVHPHPGVRENLPTAQPPHQLPAHNLNLLNVLKSNQAQSAANVRPQHPTVTTTTTQFGQSVSSTVTHNGASHPNGQKVTMETVATTVAGSSGTTEAGTDARMTKHRSALLDMFKKTSPPALQGQIDGQGMSHTPTQYGNDNQAGRQMNQAPSAAEALRSAAQEKGRPVQMNPDTNLPFGAVSILSRPRPGQEAPSKPEPPAHKTDEELARTLAQIKPFAKASPAQSSPGHLKSQAVAQDRPNFAQSYPYGAPSQEGAKGPLSVQPSPPAASTLPIPSTMKRRQDSSSEHKSALLSLFGKSKSGLDASQGADSAMTEATSASGTTPRSRLASVASSRGEGAGRPDSRKGSQTPLSPADRNFLLGFLENASNKSKT